MCVVNTCTELGEGASRSEHVPLSAESGGRIDEEALRPTSELGDVAAAGNVRLSKSALVRGGFDEAEPFAVQGRRADACRVDVALVAALAGGLQSSDALRGAGAGRDLGGLWV